MRLLEHHTMLRVRMPARDDGVNRVFGETTVAGNPETSVACRVQMMRSVREPVHIREQWSEGNGAYVFDWLGFRSASDGYTVIAYDHTGVHKPAAAANLVPSPMPPDPAEHP